LPAVSAAAVAVVLYVAYWIAVLFGYLRLDSSDFSDPVFELLRAAAVILPALALGFVVGRWRAALTGLVFLLAVALPERTVVDGDGVDVTLVGIYGVSLKEALALIAVTTPCVILGVVLRRMRRSRPASVEAREPESGTPSAAGAPSGPS
jgi:ABC-type transport system involved in cytochrome c biogenesis permease component